MPNDIRYSVVLPREDGVSIVPEGWWMENGVQGTVPTALLVPDPNYLRCHRNSRTPQLSAGRAWRKRAAVPIIVTPLSRVSRMSTSGTYGDAFFVIVSGYEEWQEALDTGAPEVLVMVLLYEDAAEHELDMALPDRWFETRNYLDEGYAIAYLLEQGIAEDRICLKVGKTKPVINHRKALTQLAPDIQELLKHRKKGKPGQLPTSTARILGSLGPPSGEVLSVLLSRSRGVAIKVHRMSDDERRFCLQRILLKDIRSKGLSIREAEDYLLDFTDRTCPASGFGSKRSKSRQDAPSVDESAQKKSVSRRTPLRPITTMPISQNTSGGSVCRSFVKFPFIAVFWHYGPPGKLAHGEVRSPMHFRYLWENKLFGWQMRKDIPKPTDFPDIKEVDAMCAR